MKRSVRGLFVWMMVRNEKSCANEDLRRLLKIGDDWHLYQTVAENYIDSERYIECHRDLEEICQVKATGVHSFYGACAHIRSSKKMG